MREPKKIHERSEGAGLEQKIIFDFTPETRFTETKSSERRKIEFKRRSIAANDDELQRTTTAFLKVQSGCNLN
jgi:hypothetical protein